MRKYDQAQLFTAIKDYDRRKKSLIASAKKAVKEWRPANAVMYGLFPWSKQIQHRGTGNWIPAKGVWLESPDKSETPLMHGYDQDGELQIIEYKRGEPTLFVRNSDVIDEVRYGGMKTRLLRWVLSKNRVVACYDYNLSPHQYSYETFEYDRDRCIRSVENSWYVDSKNKWVTSTITTTCEYEFDDQGLLRAHQDMGGKDSWGRKLVFQRPAGRKKAKTVNRRSFVGYTLAVSAETKEPEDLLCSDAYGLEMSIDDEWPIDTVLFMPERFVEALPDTSGLRSMGTVYVGIVGNPNAALIKQAKASGANWWFLDASKSEITEQLKLTTKAKFSCALLVSKVAEISNLLKNTPTLNFKNCVVVLAPQKKDDLKATQSLAEQVRHELQQHKLGSMRIVAATTSKNPKVEKLSNYSDLDGLFLLDSNYADALEVLRYLALVRS